jgi:hypothetical protein
MDGAWAEIETLTRMTRQYSYTSRWQHPMTGFVADGLALRWAADPRQTVASLENAARAWKQLSPGASPAERIRIDAALFHNLLDLPREELIDELLGGQAARKRKVSSFVKLRFDLQTNPWEITRARRAFNLLSAARIQRFEKSQNPFVPQRDGIRNEYWSRINGMVDPDWGFLVVEDGRTIVVSPGELNALTYTTPLLESSLMGLHSMFQGRSQVIQRAIWLTLLLRLHQARHDGKLPASLDEILAQPGEGGDLAATPEDLVDPYSGKRFGYVASQGQTLLPIGTTESLSSPNTRRFTTPLESTEGYRLLYSVGPDGVDNMAERNVAFDQQGDLIFPLKDDVKPPETEPR